MSALCLAAATDAFLVPQAAIAQNDHAIDIPAGPLSASLEILARQTGLSIGMNGRLPNIVAPSVHGRMAAEAALAHLLGGSGLRAVRMGPRAFRLERVAAPPPLALPAPAEQPIPTMTGPDILVTGVKRAESLATLPLSVSVASLRERRRHHSLPATAEVTAQVNGLSVTNLGPGRNRQFIRGIADSPFNGPSQSTVAVMLDDARVTYDAPDPDLRLVDVDRVEILKGPQGPLYGAGALGGIYHVVTVKPDMEKFEGSTAVYGSSVQSGGVGGGGEAIVNLPLVKDRLAVRAVGYGAGEPGWIDTVSDTGLRDNGNSAHVRGGRLALAWQPGADWKLDMGGALQYVDVDDSQYVLTSSHSLTRSNILPEPHDNDFRTVHGTITGRIGALDFLSTTSWVDHDVDSIYDASAVAGRFGLSGPVQFADQRNYTIVNQELRLSNNPAARLNWVGGLSLLSATRRVAGMLEPLDGSPGLQIETIHQRTTEVAAFGEMTLPLFDDVKATAGGRLFWSRTEDERTEAKGLKAVNTVNAGLTPSLSLSWQPDRRHFFYLRYASALRPGGLSPSGTSGEGRFRSDDLSSFDLGTRMALAGDALTLEASLYLSFWRHVQSDYLLDNGLVGTRNAGDARIYGSEAMLRWAPVGGWALELGLALQQARLVRAEDGTRLGNDTRLPVVPDISGRAMVSRKIAIGPWTGSAELRANYVGSSRLSFDSGLDRRMGDYVAAGASAWLSRKGWTVSAGVENALNLRADSFAFGNPFTVRANPQYTPLQPRTVTLSLRRDW